jgi:choice-of-anchor B domain-containing protein
MIKKTFLFVFSLSLSIGVKAQLNTELIAQFTYDHELNDVWGYTSPDSTEYALVGTVRGVSILSLRNPQAPEQVAFIPGMYSLWRDIKTFGHFAYVVADQPGSSDGLLIIDLSELPERVQFYNWRPTLEGLGPLQRCHNLYIDEDGFCYLSGCNLNFGGILIFDVNTIDGHPKYIEKGPSVYSHDVYAKDGLMYSSEIYAGQLSIYEVAEKNRIQKTGATYTPYRFTHNAWVSEDGQFVYTTDEKGNAPVTGFDITNFNNIKETDQFRPKATMGQGVIPHNVHVKDAFLHISYYTDGGIIVDASDPFHLVEVANYDTEKDRTNGFFGAWGMYPFFESGLVLISDINNGLFVIKPLLKRAARLGGMIKDADSGAALFGVQVHILETLEVGASEFSGKYKVGIADGGHYQVEFKKPGYLPYILEVEFINGESLIQDIFLNPINTYKVEGIVRNTTSGIPIEGALIEIRNENSVYKMTSDVNGSFSFPAIYADEFALIFGKWGFKTTLDSIHISGDKQLSLTLEQGYYDDFELNLGWETYYDQNATSGFWERDIPVGTIFNGMISNPAFDSPNDKGNQCYITGNKGGSAGDDDVDDGYVFLKSPIIDLKNYTNATLTADIWFFNDGGNTPANDTLKLFAQTINEQILLFQTVESASTWRTISIPLPSLLMDEPFQLLIETGDPLPFGHIVEAGIDAISIEESLVNRSKNEEFTDLSWNFFPNPAQHYIVFDHSLHHYSVEIIHSGGQVVLSTILRDPVISVNHLNPGIYFIRVYNHLEAKFYETKSLLIAR